MAKYLVALTLAAILVSCLNFDVSPRPVSGPLSTNELVLPRSVTDEVAGIVGHELVEFFYATTTFD